MENFIVAEVATIGNDDNDIDKPAPKQIGMNQIWS